MVKDNIFNPFNDVSGMESEQQYADNFSIIATRWPELANVLAQTEINYERLELLNGRCFSLVCDGIQINSTYDAISEADVIIAQLPEQAIGKVSIYGVGQGVVIQELLQQRTDIEKVEVFVFNLMMFKMTLRLVDCSNWLLSNKLTLRLASTSKYVSSPFVAIPAELSVCDDNCDVLRDRVCLELDSQRIDHQTCFDNPDIKARINSNLLNMQNSKDIKSFKLDTTKLCVIAAAGPTLSLHIDWLKEQQALENITLIAVDAAAKPLMHHGIRPDLIVSIDKIGGDLFGEIESEQLLGVSLLYFPLVAAEFVTQWQGDTYASFSSGDSFEPLVDHCDKTRLYSGGSVIHPSIDAVVKLGVKQILMLGADFSFINEQRHAEYTQQFSHFNPLAPKDCKHWVKNGFGDRNPTYLNYRGYLRDLEHYIALHPQVTFYNGSKLGAAIQGAHLFEEFI